MIDVATVGLRVELMGRGPEPTPPACDAGLYIRPPRPVRMSLPDRLRPHRLRTRLLAANLSLALLVLAVFGVLTSSVLAEREAGQQAEHSGRVITATHRLEKDI